MAGIGGGGFVPGGMEPGGIPNTSVAAIPAFMQLVASGVLPSISSVFPSPSPSPGLRGFGLTWELIAHTSVAADLAILPRSLNGSPVPQFFDSRQRTQTFTLAAKMVEASDAAAISAIVLSGAAGNQTFPLHGGTGSVTGFINKFGSEQIPGVTQVNLTIELIVADPYVFELIAHNSIAADLIMFRRATRGSNLPQFFDDGQRTQTFTLSAKYVDAGFAAGLATQFTGGVSSVSLNAQTGAVSGFPLKFSSEQILGISEVNITAELLVANVYSVEFITKESVSVGLVIAKGLPSSSGGTVPADQIFQTQSPDHTATGTARYAPGGTGASFIGKALTSPPGTVTIAGPNGSFTGIPIKAEVETILGTSVENVSVTVLIPFG